MRCHKESVWDCVKISHWLEEIAGMGWGWLWDLLDVLAFLVVLFLIWDLGRAIFLANRQPVIRCGALKTKRLPDGTRKLLRDLKVKVGAAEPIIVKKGFRTDYSSIPTSLQWTMHWSKVDVAGVVHDWLYANGKTVQETMTRKETDDIWRAIALHGKHSVNRLQAALGWLALRWFGRGIWKRYLTNPPDYLLPRKTKCCEEAEECDGCKPPEEGNGKTPEEAGKPRAEEDNN